MWTLAELSRLGLASIGSELCANDARQRLATLPEWGPRACHFAAFECRLRGDDPRVDVSFALQGASARAAVRHWLRTNGAQAPEQPSFATCHALLAAWAADSGVISELGSLWIEVDLEPGRAPAPFVYCRPERAGQFWQRGDANRVGPLLETWARFSGGRLTHATRERLTHCIETLPDGARVLLLAPQLHQRRNALRMSFRVSADRLLPYLERVGWPGSRAALAEQLQCMRAQHWAMPIQIDIVDGQLGPNISLEFVQSRENDYAEPCEPVLAALRQLGACSEALAGALLRWRYGLSGVAHDDVLSVDKLLDLKLTLAGDGSLHSKAYLGTLGVNRYFQLPSARSREPAPAPSAADG